MVWAEELNGNSFHAETLLSKPNDTPEISNSVELTEIPEGFQPEDMPFLNKFLSIDLTMELMDIDNCNIDSLDWKMELSGGASSLVEPELPKNHRNKLTPPGEMVPIHLLFPDPEKLEFYGFIGINTLKEEIDDKRRILRQIIAESRKELSGGREANSSPRQSRLVSALIDLPLPDIINSSQTLTRSHVKQLQRSVPGRPSSMT